MPLPPVELAKLFDRVPTDLSEFFNETADGLLSSRLELELNLLDVAEAVQCSKDFREFHPVVGLLNGVILDDPNTSNHHVYLSNHPCAGTVFYLDHDGDSRIVFPSLAEFLASARSALQTRQYLTVFHPPCGVLLKEQRGLTQLVNDLLDGHYDCESTEIIVVLIPSMDLTDFPLMERLAINEDFYITEALGDAIVSRPRRELEPIAIMCQQHMHIQAAKAGSRAVAAISALQ